MPGLIVVARISNRTTEMDDGRERGFASRRVTGQRRNAGNGYFCDAGLPGADWATV